MDSCFTLEEDNPKEKANIFSKLFFGWIIKLCYTGIKRKLKILDLYKVTKDNLSESITDKLEINWDNELYKAKEKNKKPSLLKALIKTFFWRYMLYGIILFIQYVIIRSFQPVVLGYFVGLFLGNNHDTDAMYISGAILISISIIIVFSTHHTEFGQACIGMRIRVALSSLIYRKILKLNKKSLNTTASGQVINLLSNDVSRFDLVMSTLHYFWITPFQTLVITYLIWRQVGISSLAGVLSMVVLTLPLQGYMGKISSSLRLKVAERTDRRVKLMNEVISGIQVIKMYAWEKPFEKLIKITRKKEINVLTKTSYLRGIYMSFMVFVERTTLCLTVICYVLLGNNDITADKIFSLAQFFNILQLVMAIFYPLAISLGAETLVSIKRLQDFLMLEEKKEANIQKLPNNGIILKNIYASWTSSLDNYTLKHLNIEIPPGTLCAIIGPVASGKSSILQLLLGELLPTSGNIHLGGILSYSSQEPWLFASTVRNNILFGHPYDRNHYRNVVHVCALEKDFEQFPHGDKTMVGERGMSLSGGQKARINLARAIYRQADIYLLDDPLSAVDTHVGKHLFEKCFLRYLKSKTRILITHQLQYLKKADHIIVINHGEIEAQGTFEDLSNSTLDFTKLLGNSDESVENNHSTSERGERRTSDTSMLSFMTDSVIQDIPEKNEEVMSTPGINPFREYIKTSGNCCTIFSLIIILILSQIACSCADYWITFWTQQEEIRSINHIDFIPLNSKRSFNNLNETFYELRNILTEEVIINNETYHLIRTNMAMYIYGAIIIAAIILTLIRSFAFFKMVMIASKNLHNKMFHALLKAPMRFFDITPSGRILNRFSKDMGSIDEVLPRVLMDAIQILLVMTGILIMILIANYYMIIALIILGYLFLKVRSWYISTAKDIKHLEGITKSPVFSHLNSSLYGIITIRAYMVENILRKEFDCHQDVHSSAWFLTIAARVAFGLWLDVICILFITIIVFSFIFLNQYVQVSGSLVGLAISQSLILTGMLQYGMRQTSEVINQLTSVERILEYTKLPNEEQLNTDNKLDESWPQHGTIIFDHMYLKYATDEPPILKDLNLYIESGWKVGIVGRTGAGKSSLISALFKLAPIEGKILIDNIDTKKIKLMDLRKNISIIPQEPVLFSASLRYNLDPFNEYNDNEIWKALEAVKLKESTISLDYMVSEGGSNFSLGQRQLLCLARAILRNNKILILDEATANVDPGTDILIQQTIRQKFKNCTVLTIAHRLNTIMDSDKVLVMDGGTMIEFNHPYILLQNNEGHFFQMVAQTGSIMAEQLYDISAKCYYKSNNK